MKLKDLLKNKHENTNITYRTKQGYRDILLGFCFWNQKEIVPLDYDNSSLEDEIVEYVWKDPNILTVWIESE